MIIHYFAEENIFAVIVYLLSLQKKNLKMPKREKFVKLRNFERKIQFLFMIYMYFEIILVLEDNENQSLNESYINKY